MPDATVALERLAVALLIGLLAGIDRERGRERERRERLGGVRTFPLIALAGAGLALAHAQVGVAPLVAGMVALAALALRAYVAHAGEGARGATTEVAAIVTFVLGMLAGLGQIVVAGAAGVAVAVLLAAKPPLERFSRAISESEMTAVLELAVISAIVLPILPDRGYGPWHALNPRQIWLVVVLVSAVSFGGFLAERWRGPHAGLYLGAALGALVSSTATTASMAARAREAPGEAHELAAAATLASVVMCARVFGLVVVLGRPLVPRLAIALGAMAVAGAIAVLVLARLQRAGARGAAGAHASSPASAARGAPALKPPIDLRSALIFGAAFAGVLLLVNASRAWLGSAGPLIAAGLSGLVDVDAITIALSRGAGETARTQAAVGIVIACAANNIFKAGSAVALGKGRFRALVPIALGAMSIAGGAAVALTIFLH